jgi:transitional endoplasmic reticulum ATPase
MSWDRLIDFAEKQKAYEQQRVEIFAQIEVFPFEGAYALWSELNERFGYANAVATQGMFGEELPQTISVPISKTESVQVPWGAFTIPGVDGRLEAGLGRNPDGRAIFTLRGTVRRASEKIVNEIVEGVKRRVREESLWKSKAWRLRLTDDNGESIPMPMPEFMDLPAEAEHELTFSAEVEAAFRINLWNQIEHREKMRSVGFPDKRGVLLAGGYGTGKSMASTVTAIKAIRNGYTFINVDRADELGDIVRLARDYQPAVVFCEDIDRVVSGGRDLHLDELLNIIDGVEAKGTEIIIVLTTNDVHSIHQSMLRPGRLDAIINVAPPDATAVDRLMRVYSRGLIDLDEDITAAAQQLAGEKTAVVREVVERAKSAWVDNHDTDMDPLDMRLTGKDLLDAAHSMRNQLDLLAEREPDTRSEFEKAAQIRADAVRELAEAVKHQPVVTEVPAMAAEPLVATTEE